MKTNQEGVRGSLGLGSPWEILSDEYDNPDRVRRVMLTCSDTSSLTCPQCKEVYTFYDLRTARFWHHLDTCTYRTELIARIPRVKRPAHGVRTVEVPWASPSSRFTYLNLPPDIGLQVPNRAIFFIFGYILLYF